MTSRSGVARTFTLHWLLVFMALHQTGSGIVSQLKLKNPGFESPVSQIAMVPGWDVSIKKGQESSVSIQADASEFKERYRSLSIVAKQPTDLKISQGIILPVAQRGESACKRRGRPLIPIMARRQAEHWSLRLRREIKQGPHSRSERFRGPSELRLLDSRGGYLSMALACLPVAALPI
jgi:hypothetical protein